MDYYEPTVEKYIAADRKTFISPQYWIPLPTTEKPGTGIWIDALAISISDNHCYLCEITFAKEPPSILKHLTRFAAERERIQNFLLEKSNIPSGWPVRPWLFILQSTAEKLIPRLPSDYNPKITYLEFTAPWFYPNGFREGEPGKPYSGIPVQFQ